MSLADELLADLEETEQEYLAELVKDELDSDNEDAAMGEGHPAGDSKDDYSDDGHTSAMEVDVRVSSIRELCKLHDSDRLAGVLAQIDFYIDKPRKSNEMIGNVESDPEYQLIVEANSLAVEIDNEICKFISWLYEIYKIHIFFAFFCLAIIHKFTKEKYQKRFPELDSLIVGEMEYMHAVKELGNELDEAKNNEKLQQILTQATIMIVSVTASTTQGWA